MSTKSVKELFKPVSVKKLKEQSSKEDSQTGSGNGGFLTLDTGSNKIRFLPPHPGKEQYYVLEKKHFIPAEKDDGQMGRTTVLNSITHGATKRDIIEEYIAFTKKSNPDKIEIITGFSTGLSPSFSYISYAYKISGDTKTFGRFQMNKTIRDAVNNATFVEDGEDPIEVDPFTDVEDGVPVIIKFTPKSGKKKASYDVQLSKKASPLSEEELEAFLKVTPLDELYNKSYTIKDFEKALVGLQLFDAEHEIEAFDNDEFNEIVDEVRAQYDSSPFKDDEDESPKKKKVTKGKEEPKKKASKVVVEEEEGEEETEEDEPSKEGDEFDGMDRQELLRFIKKNSIDVTVKKSWEDDEIREKIREATKETEEEEEEEEEIEEEEEEAPKKARVSMADIKAKLKAGKK